MTRAIEVGGRQGRGNPGERDEQPSLLASSWFWYGGIASLCVWSAIWMVLP